MSFHKACQPDFHLTDEDEYPVKPDLLFCGPQVNKFITVKIAGRFAITLIYKWHPQSLELSLAPIKHKSLPPCLPDTVGLEVSLLSFSFPFLLFFSFFLFFLWY
jgi:hypothetical protein